MDALMWAFHDAVTRGEGEELARSLETGRKSIYAGANLVLETAEGATEVAHLVIHLFAKDKPDAAKWVAKYYGLEGGAIWIVLDQTCRMGQLENAEWTAREYALAEKAAQDQACKREAGHILEEIKDPRQHHPDAERTALFLEAHFGIESASTDVEANAIDEILLLYTEMKRSEEQLDRSKEKFEKARMRLVGGITDEQLAGLRERPEGERLAYPHRTPRKGLTPA
jgi:hypothetical protein